MTCCGQAEKRNRYPTIRNCATHGTLVPRDIWIAWFHATDNREVPSRYACANISNRVKMPRDVIAKLLFWELWGVSDTAAPMDILFRAGAPAPATLARRHHLGTSGLSPTSRLQHHL